MAQAPKIARTTIVGEADGKPLSDDVKTKVQDALKSAIEKELIPTVGGIVGTHHWSVTHGSIVFDES